MFKTKVLTTVFAVTLVFGGAVYAQTQDQLQDKTQDRLQDKSRDRIQDRDRVKQDTGSGFGSGSGMGGGSGMGRGSGMPAAPGGMGGHK